MVLDALAVEDGYVGHDFLLGELWWVRTTGH
jgi:hypothetical protein